jgi:RHS repeat-associated protein
VTGNYAYDVLGRQTTIPGVDTQAGGTTGSPNNVTLAYRSDDLVNSLVQGSACESFTYDPLGDVVTTSNYASSSCSGAVTTSTNAYAGGSSPAWTTTGSSTTAFFDGITQGNALNVTLAGTASPSCLGISTASCTLNLTDMRGDIVATAALTSGTATVSGYSETTEFGLPRSASTEASVAPTYGWLGVHEKAANNLSGLVVMGVRIYNPTTGLFTSPDPIYGGNDNAYVYPSDPINGLDLSGKQAPPKALLAAEAATASHKAFCKSHPGIEGHSCGGFFHELGGTLSKTVDESGITATAKTFACVATSFWPTSPSLGLAFTNSGALGLGAGGIIYANVGEGVGATIIATGGVGVMAVGAGVIVVGVIEYVRECRQ